MKNSKTMEELVAENFALRKDNSNLKILLKTALSLIPESNLPTGCLGCGHDYDEEHKADCLIANL